MDIRSCFSGFACFPCQISTNTVSQCPPAGYPVAHGTLVSFAPDFLWGQTTFWAFFAVCPPLFNGANDTFARQVRVRVSRDGPVPAKMAVFAGNGVWRWTCKRSKPQLSSRARVLLPLHIVCVSRNTPASHIFVTHSTTHPIPHPLLIVCVNRNTYAGHIFITHSTTFPIPHPLHIVCVRENTTTSHFSLTHSTAFPIGTPCCFRVDT